MYKHHWSLTSDARAMLKARLMKKKNIITVYASLQLL